MKYAFKQLVDVPALQFLTDELYKATAIPSAIITMDGEILTGSGWQRLCTEFHRKHPEIERECRESDIRLRDRLADGEPFVLYRCPRGLVDASSPVTIEGEHVANVFAGQLFTEAPGPAVEAVFRAQARRFGFDEEAYIEAFREIPVLPEERFRPILRFLAQFAELIAKMGLARLREREAQDQIRTSERKFQRLLESTNTVPWEFDLGTQRFTYVGPQSARLLGRPASHWTDGDAWFSAVHPEDRESVRRHRESETALGRDHECTYRMLKPDGSIVWVQDVVRVVSGASGPERLVGFLHDVTQRVEAEEALRDSEENYRQLFDAESDALFLIDNESGRILQANRAAGDLYGYSPEELLALCNTDLSGEPEETSQVTQTTEVVFERVVTIPLRWHRKQDGTVFPVEISGRFFTHHGRPVHIAAIRDITQRKRAEEELRESQARLSLALQSARMGVWRWDISDDRLHVDDQFCRLLGIDPGAFSGAAAEFFATVHPEDRQVLREAMAQTVGRGVPYAPEYRVVWPDASVHHLTHRGALVRDHQGRSQRVNGVVWDITEAKQAEEQRRTLGERVRQSQKLEAVGTLAGGIAHDFNNILTPLLGYAELALLQLGETDPVRADITQLLVAAERAKELVQQILVISRKHAEGPLVPLPLGPLVREVTKFLRASLPTTIEIRVQLDPACGLVLGDLS